MYRVGFGDCFLVSLPIAEGSPGGGSYAHILVDCGVHAKGDIGTIGAVVDNIAAVTGKKLAVVIATHAHQDHIAGFDRFGQNFSTFEIGEVWLPWTWDPHNKDAVQMQKKQASLTAQLTQHFDALTAASPSEVNTGALEAINNLKGNAHAIALLNAGFGVNAKVRYLKAGDILASDGSNGSTDSSPIPGLTVHLLGPPTSVDFLAQMNPGKDHYLRLGPAGEASDTAVKPFSQKWRFDPKDEPDYPSLSAEQEKELQNLTGSSLENLAFALDQARNNESVVTLFVYRGEYLLFPGDAQYGNWKWWLENLHPEDVLPKVGFFKVAHHGSINATPKSALDQLTDGKSAAMVSTQSTPWNSIPRVPLMTAFDEKTGHRIVRSDWLDVKGGPAPLKGTAPDKPAALPSGFSQGALWYDYLLKI
jgi:hypothetical protein